MEAKVANNLVKVRPNDRGEMGKWLTVEVPNGWDDVKKLTNKVLEFENRKYAFRGWNSDRNEAFFREGDNFAKVLRA